MPKITEVSDVDVSRIVEGLKDALRITACDHAQVAPAGRMWWCTNCGGTFSQKPPSAEGTEAAEVVS
jgi:hypothetical protein